MRTIRLNLSFDGTDFQGWQKQPGLRTVQGTLETAIQTVCREAADTVGCARTDAGVHAAAYVASFRTESDIPITRLGVSLNGCLPDDIAIHSAQEVPDDFHARFSARSRRYVYRISEAPTAIGRWYVLDTHYTLDEERMTRAAVHLLGEHDFSSFTPVTNDANKICRVVDLSVVRNGARTEITVEATRFVHHMVRAIAGTLMEVGRGRMEPEQVGEVLRKKDRRHAGPTAPAHGLMLMRVRYDSDSGSGASGFG